MSSLKLRLVIYFVLLSLLPIVVALWGFSQEAGRSELARADLRLSTALRVALARYVEQAQEPQREATALARLPRVSQAFSTADRETLAAIASGNRWVWFTIRGRTLAGRPPERTAVVRAAAAIDARGRTIGRVHVAKPIDAGFLEGLGRLAGLERDDVVALVSNRRIVASSGRLDGLTLVPPQAAPGFVDVGSSEYRALAVQLPSTRPAGLLAVLMPRLALDPAVASERRRLVVLSLLAIVIVAALAYIVGRAIVHPLHALSEAAAAIARGHFSQRVPVRGHDELARLGRTFNEMARQLERRLEELAAERIRARSAVARFGEALAATHDPHTLLPVIVESTVQAVGAVGGRLMVAGREMARAGDPDRGGEPLVLEIGEDEPTQLVLRPAGESFSAEARELAHWLAGQASVALENARLHRRVEHEAVTDSLTELANRRAFETSLAHEISRSDRFGTNLGLVFADLDHFKQVNDRFGHQTGDDVLSAFAETIRSNVREIDLPVRYGGEEFAVLLPQTNLAGAARLAERIRVALAERPIRTADGETFYVTASFGVAAYPHEPSENALLHAADAALYRAKAQGRNRVVAAGESLSMGARRGNIGPV